MMLLVLFCSFVSVLAKDWAVIVAGSKSYGNYRHQADACHAYQVVSKHGIPDERIITMFYDDIAENKANPYKGQIFNKPTAKGVPGVDVYQGCKKDYTGKHVTPLNFIRVMTGANGTFGGPVLQSTADDNVFINFVDHGGVGLIAFPSGSMSSTMLNNALKTMHEKKMYKKLVFYLEACESGSMFQSLLPNDINVYATTAANAKESSWGTYCPPDDKINGIDMKTCLGDLYSVNWMENAEKVGMQETLADQYALVKAETTKSHVEAYGTLLFTKDPIGDFMGDKSNKGTSMGITPKRSSTDVDSRDIPLHLAYYNYLRAGEDFETRQKLGALLIEQIASRATADQLFHNLVTLVAADHSTALFYSPAQLTGECKCCDEVHEAVSQHCGGYDDYSLKYARVVVNLCGVSNSDTIISHLKQLC